MEFIGEPLLALLQIVAELVLQMTFEVLAELGLRSVREPFRRPKPLNPWVAAVGYFIFGAIAGWLSLLLFPALAISRYWLRILNLIVTPVAAGLLMGAIGAWRRRRAQELVRLDHFGYGFAFALAMALVRFGWGR